jgi:competence protein ComEA
MRLTDRQLDGAIVIIIISVAVFLVTRLSLLFSSGTFTIPFGDKSSGPLAVMIADDVSCQKGFYYLPEKSTVYNLLRAADVENLDKFNNDILQKQLSTGNAVLIESGDRLIVREMENTNKIALDIPINLNKATIDDLVLIPGIGEKTAHQIVRFREKWGNFKKLDDMMKIRGIKEKKFSKMKKYFRIS